MKNIFLLLCYTALSLALHGQNETNTCKQNRLLHFADSLSSFHTYHASDSILEIVFQQLDGSEQCDSLLGEVARAKGRNYIFAREFSRSDSCFTMAERLLMSSDSMINPATCRLKSNMAGLAFQRGRADIAVKLFTECEVCSSDLKLTSSYIGNTLKLVKGQMYNKLGQYDSAQVNFQEVINLYTKDSLISETTLSQAHSGIATSLFNQSQFTEAEYHFDQAIQILAALPGSSSNLHMLGITYNDKGVFLRKLSRYEAAEKYYLEALRLRAESTEEKNINYAIMLNNLGLLYELMGRYKESEETYRKAILIAKQNVGEEHIEYANMISNFAVYYIELGLYEEALELANSALDLKKRLYPESHPKIVSSYTVLSKIYHSMGKIEDALRTSKEAYRLKIKYTPKDTLGMANVNMSIAMLNYSMGHYHQADSLLNISRNLLESILNESNHMYNIVLDNQAMVDFKLGDYSTAFDNSRQSFLNRMTTVGSLHPDLESNYRGMIYSAYKLGLDSLVEEYLIQFYHYKSKQIRNNLVHLSEKEREKYYHRNLVPFFNFFFTISSNTTSDDLLATMFELNLLAREFNLRVSKSSIQYMISQKDSSLLENYHVLLGYRRQLARYYYNKNVPQASLKKIRSKSDSLSKLINTITGESIVWFDSLYFSSMDFNNYLEDDEAFVDFIWFHDIESEKAYKYQYGAFVLTKNGLKYSHLTDNDQFNSALIKYHEGESKDLRRILWEKIEPDLLASNAIYYAPAGGVYRTSLGLIEDESGQLLSTSYEFHTVSSLVNISKHDFTSSLMDNAIVFGGVEYNSTTMHVDSTSTRQIAPPRDLTYLPYTEEERSFVVSTCRNHGVDVVTYNGKEASEEKLRQLIHQKSSPNLIHLATHGYISNDTTKKRGNIFSEQILTWENFQLQRSGIILAGSNLNQIETIDENLDGYLTGLDFSEMNLHQTKLVILSTCESGLGEIGGYEGIYNLVRAFKKAGASHIIATTNQISDREAYQFMRLFYEEWFGSNASIHTAFYNTQKLMVNNPETANISRSFMLIE